MAYATSNPIKKVSQMGESNSLWYYNDGDAIGTIVGTDYFLADYEQLTAGDIILISSGGSNVVVDTVIVSAASSSTVTTVIEA
jgi:hypothetical protein|tara:strand:+ start:547 stop:795 length:249 start_codon:yes stop_codon:yes gene_type:complete